MKIGYVSKLLVATVVVVFSVGSASAEGDCGDGDIWAIQCTGGLNVCGSATAACVVKVSEAGGKVTVRQVNNPDASVICVTPGQGVEFDEDYDDNASFLLTFGEKKPKTSPFPTPVLLGDKAQPALQTTGAKEKGCYAYKIYHHVPQHGWKTLDPKIIVGGGGSLLDKFKEWFQEIVAKVKMFLKGIGLL